MNSKEEEKKRKLKDLEKTQGSKEKKIQNNKNDNESNIHLDNFFIPEQAEEFVLELKNTISKDYRHDVKELTDFVQKELNEMLDAPLQEEDKNENTNNKNQTKTDALDKNDDSVNDSQIPIKNKSGNLIVFEKNKKSPSPYLVDLKPKVKKITAPKVIKIEKPKLLNTQINQTIGEVVFSKKDLAQYTPESNYIFSAKLANLKYKIKWYKSLVTFAVIAILAVLSVHTLTLYNNLEDKQERILHYSQSAFNNLNQGQDALKELKFEVANVHFSNATREFVSAQKELDTINFVLLNIIKKIPILSDKIIAGEQILNAGSRLSLCAKFFSQALDNVNKEELFTEKIKHIKTASEKTVQLLNEANENLNAVDLSQIPTQYKDVFITTKNNLPFAQIIINNAVNLSDFLVDIIGEQEKKRYLVLFQNNAEIRPTGGFIGSFALIDVFQGKITNINIPEGGTYDMQGGLVKKIRSPKPLQLVSSKWQMHDSNWFSDFEAASKKISWFYEQSGGPSVDGVIAINLPVMENLLNIIGPIQMPDYEKIINTDNFWIETQKAVELEYDKKENKPKKFIADLTPKIIDQILNSDNNSAINLIALLNKSLIEKDILMYFNNPDNEKIVKNYGWDGKIKNSPQDFIAVINTNIGGSKSDRVIDQKISHIAQIQPNGEIINTIHISRTHTGIKNELFTGIRNVDYLRLYVPMGSELIETYGFDTIDEELYKKQENGSVIDKDLDDIQGKVIIDQQSGTRINNEFGKTVFGNWVLTDPGETKEITIKYKLPFKIKIDTPTLSFWEKIKSYVKDNINPTNYSILVQKQSGSDNVTFHSEILLPENLSFLKKNTLPNITLSNYRASIKNDLDQDIFYNLPIQIN